MKLLLIGQSPSRRGNPETPLIGKNGTSRLTRLADVSAETFLAKAEAVNIFETHQGKKASRGDVFDAAQAADRAKEFDLIGRDVVFLGRAVARAFGYKNAPFFMPLSASLTAARSVWCMPHPSGINRFWNKPENVAKAREFLQSRLAAVSG